MDKIKIKGGRQLNGEIFISGAKNAALPLICASLLTEETVTLTNMPILSDIKSMNLLLEQLGTQIDSFDDFVDGHPTKTYSYRTPELTSIAAPYDYVRKMRASYYVLGPLLARAGKVELSLPGGCAIGTRPMDIHLAAMEEMGAKIDIRAHCFSYGFGRRNLQCFDGGNTGRRHYGFGKCSQRAGNRRFNQLIERHGRQDFGHRHFHSDD